MVFNFPILVIFVSLQDVDCLELAHLRDARNGKYAVVPKVNMLT